MIITFIMLAFDNHSHEETMAAQIIKFCNKAERKKADERAKRAWDDTFHLTLTGLTRLKIIWCGWFNIGFITQ